MTEHVRTQGAAHPPHVYEARDERANPEQAALDELVAHTERCLAFAHSSDLALHQNPRSAISDLIAHITQSRAYLWWERPTVEQTQGYDRVVEVGWQNRRYGFLGLAPGYLASIMAPNLPSLFASLCGQTIALIEHQLLIEYQITRLAPLEVREKLTPRERDMLYSLALDESKDEAAQRLCIAPTTVVTHRHRLYQKLGAHDAHQAVMRGFALGYLDVFDLPTRG